MYLFAKYSAYFYVQFPPLLSFIPKDATLGHYLWRTGAGKRYR